MFDLIYRLLVGPPPPSHGSMGRHRYKGGCIPRGGKGKLSPPHTHTRKPTAPAPGRSSSASAPSTGVTVYHGTPSQENAKSIVRHGWIVGIGNALGDGVYVTTSITIARNYAGSNGYVVKARLQPGKCAVWSASLDRAFRGWVASRACAPDMSARTAFLLERGYRTLRQDNVYVVLMRGYRNPAATKVKLRSLHVDEVQHAASGHRVRF